jgi:hypothetical protein
MVAVAPRPIGAAQSASARWLLLLGAAASLAALASPSIEVTHAFVWSTLALAIIASSGCFF